MAREPISDANLKVFAQNVGVGAVFTDREIEPEDEHLAAQIFSLDKVSDAQMKEMEELKPVLLFSYREFTTGFMVKHYPVFRTFHYLTKEEDDKVKVYMTELARWIDGGELPVESSSKLSG